MPTKYPTIKAALKERLLAGRYREGEPLPSETRVALEFGVSRMTARRAMDELEREGLVRRVQGAGSFPTGRRFQQGAFRIRPLEEIAAGRQPFTRVLEAGLGRAAADVADALGVPRGAAVLNVVRLRGVDGEPLLLERRALRVDRAEKLLRHNLAVESIHDLLVGRLGIDLARVEQSLEAVGLGPDEARHLGLPAGRAAFLLTRTTWGHDGPLAIARYWIRGDRHTFLGDFEP